ncbi:MAG: hypothetical protein LUG47_08805, partial [Clostridiales bacterium]|nr:hypothetical protein [Clostridiales bacterium]
MCEKYPWLTRRPSLSLRKIWRHLLRFYEQERGILRFYHLNIPAMVNGLHDLAAPWKEYTSEMTAVLGAGQFSTEDELDEVISYGSMMAGSKGRIYTFFSEQHTMMYLVKGTLVGPEIHHG